MWMNKKLKYKVLSRDEELRSKYIFKLTLFLKQRINEGYFSNNKYFFKKRHLDLIIIFQSPKISKTQKIFNF